MLEVVDVLGISLFDLLFNKLIYNTVALSGAGRTQYDGRAEGVYDIDPTVVPPLVIVEPRRQVHRVFVLDQARLLHERFILIVERIVHQAVFQKAAHPYSAHKQTDIPGRERQYIETRARRRRQGHIEQPPVEEEQHEARRERCNDLAPGGLLVLDPPGSETREGEEEYGEKFGVEDAAEQSRRAVEIQQNPVHDADGYAPFQDMFVAVPIDVDDHEQNTQRPHKVHDLGQAPQIVFLLHDFRFFDCPGTNIPGLSHPTRREMRRWQLVASIWQPLALQPLRCR